MTRLQSRRLLRAKQHRERMKTTNVLKCGLITRGLITRKKAYAQYAVFNPISERWEPTAHPEFHRANGDDVRLIAIKY